MTETDGTAAVVPSAAGGLVFATPEEDAWTTSPEDASVEELDEDDEALVESVVAVVVAVRVVASVSVVPVDRALSGPAPGCADEGGLGTICELTCPAAASKSGCCCPAKTTRRVLADAAAFAPAACVFRRGGSSVSLDAVCLSGCAVELVVVVVVVDSPVAPVDVVADVACDVSVECEVVSWVLESVDELDDDDERRSADAAGGLLPDDDGLSSADARSAFSKFPS